jgi:hypothetical protein
LKNIKISFFAHPETPLTTYETNQKAGNSIYATKLVAVERKLKKRIQHLRCPFRLRNRKHLTTRDLSLKAKI